MTTRLLRLTLPAALALTLAIILLSAYLRLHEAGTGCRPWPACYAQLPPAGESPAPLASLKKTHRLMATLLVLTAGLIIVGVHRAGRRSMKPLAWTAAGLLIVLSVIGPLTPQKQFPVFATLNVLCGLLLLAAFARLWWHHLGLRRGIGKASPRLRRGARGGLVLLIAAVATGAWSSANFAPLAYAGTTDSHSAPSRPGYAFAPWRELAVDPQQRVKVDNRMLLLRPVHRGISLIAIGVLATAAFVAWRRQPALRPAATAVLALIAAGVLSGLVASNAAVPLGTVLGHNLAAAALLLAAVTFDYQLSGKSHDTI